MCKNLECNVCPKEVDEVQDTFFALWHATYTDKDVRRMRALVDVARLTGEYGNSNP